MLQVGSDKFNWDKNGVGTGYAEDLGWERLPKVFQIKSLRSGAAETFKFVSKDSFEDHVWEHLYKSPSGWSVKIVVVNDEYYTLPPEGSAHPAFDPESSWPHPWADKDDHTSRKRF